MTIYVIYDTWHEPVKKLPYGIQDAYLRKANYVFTAPENTPLPDLSDCTCVYEVQKKMKEAGFAELCGY